MKLIKTIIVLLLYFGYSVAAQEEPLSPPGDLSTGDVLLATSDYPQDYLRNITELWSLDLFRTGSQKQLFWDLEREDYRIHEVSITRGGTYLFTLEIQGRNDTGFVPLGESELVRMNLETGERAVVFSGANVVDFQLSPNATQALLRFYPEDMTFVDRYDLLLREQWCVVAWSTTSQPKCHMLIFEEDTYPRAFEWVADNLLAYTSNYPDSIHLLDTTTFTEEIIALPDGIYASEIRYIPNKVNHLLIYDTPFMVDEVGKLLTLDINSRSFSEIAEIPLNAHIVEVSPDGNYAVMAGGYPPLAILVNLQNGTVIQSYPTIYDMIWSSLQWLPTGHTLYLMGSLKFQGGTIMTVVFEPFTNTVYTILPQLGGELIVVP